MNFEGTLEAGANLRDTWDEIVRAHADREFLIFEDVCENCVTTHTYAQADRQIARYANAFDAAGIRPGDRVVVYLPNSVEFVECLLALAFIGAVVVPLDTKATAFECVSHIQVSQARAGVRWPDPPPGVPPGGGGGRPPPPPAPGRADHC